MSRIDLLQGTLGMLILRALQWGPQHGYAISQALRTQSEDILQVETGSPLPRPAPPRKAGLGARRMAHHRANQRAKFYSLTAAGRKQLTEEHARWKQMVQAIGNIMETAPAKGQS